MLHDSEIPSSQPEQGGVTSAPYSLKEDTAEDICRLLQIKNIKIDTILKIMCDKISHDEVVSILDSIKEKDGENIKEILYLSESRGLPITKKLINQNMTATVKEQNFDSLYQIVLMFFKVPSL